MKDQKIIQYLDGTASNEEAVQMEEWILSSPQNRAKFNRIKSHHIASTFDETAKEVDVDKGYKEFLSATKPQPYTLYKKLPPILKYAAMVAVLLSLGYIYVTKFSEDGNSPFQVPEGAITLELDNGMIQVVSEDGESQIVDSKGNLVGQQKGAQLVYTDEEAPIEKISYNTLSVPFGKRFDVTLSDGTKVFLNAGSSIKYPVKFLKGQDRKVYLEGEAFFDVAKDPQHPFIVNAVDLNVRVLGTRFNVSSYPEDNFVSTVLVEGSVSLLPNSGVDQTTKESLLEPGHIAQWDRSQKQILMEETDTDLYTAWMSGKVVFKHMPFKNIAKKLERHYNVTITNHNLELDEEFFTASFDIETIDKVLQTFQKNYDMEYTISNNQITIH